MLYEGYVVPPFYDSLLGKLIVHGENREAALARLGQALGLLRIGGLACTATLFSELLSVPDIQANAVHTKWLEHWLDTNTHKFTIEEGGKGRMSCRYTFGGDEHLFVEVDEAMSLEAFFVSLAITNAVRDAKISGVTEICPANASFQIKFDPDVIHPQKLLGTGKRNGGRCGTGRIHA